MLQTVFIDGPQLGVFCTETILKGIRFGPFQGKVVNTSEIKTYDDNSLMWEVLEITPSPLGQLKGGRVGGGTKIMYIPLPCLLCMVQLCRLDTSLSIPEFVGRF